MEVFNYLIASIHKSPQTIVFHTTFHSEFVVKYLKISFFWILQCRNSSMTKTTDSCSFLLKSYLIVVNLSNITLSLNHPIMYACYWRRNQRARNKLLPSMKTFCYSSPSHLTSETFVSPSALCLFFQFFVFVFQPFETTTANLQGFTHSNPSESTNQVTLSNKHMNHLFWA